jgi:hypothetical protein
LCCDSRDVSESLPSPCRGFLARRWRQIPVARSGNAVNDGLKEIFIAIAHAAAKASTTYAVSTTEQGGAAVNDVLSQHRSIKIITTLLFGFSHAAALTQRSANVTQKQVTQRRLRPNDVL